MQGVGNASVGAQSVENKRTSEKETILSTIEGSVAVL